MPRSLLSNFLSLHSRQQQNYFHFCVSPRYDCCVANLVAQQQVGFHYSYNHSLSRISTSSATLLRYYATTTTTVDIRNNLRNCD
jgi:hypothetical protein